MARHPATLVVAAVTSLVLFLSSCTSSGPGPGASRTVPSGTSSSSSSRSATTSAPISSPSTPPPSTSTYADPKVAAAVKSYENFTDAANYAQAHPPKKIGDPLPSRGNYRPYAFDPALGEVENFIFGLTRDGLIYRGTPPQPRISVTKVDTGAAPYPTITLTDCPTAPADWNEYYRTTGKPTTVKAGQVKPPYLVTVQMIFYKKHWGVYKVTPDVRRTCTPP